MDDEEKKKPKVSYLNIPSENISVHSTRGIPLHTRYTIQNKILIKTFRDLLYKELLWNLNIMLDKDVISVIVLYTFEWTHAFTPWVRTEERRSLTRDLDILSGLLPLKESHDANPIQDYEIKELIGRTLYGFDIHDSPYATVKDPNPCEIMTDQGGIFLKPVQMSNWYLNQDGRCISLPVRYRFKHMIAAAVVKSRGTGPYLELIIKPIKGVVPGTDSLLKQIDSNVTMYDADSAYSYSDINSNLVSQTKAEAELVVDDPLAKEIAKSYRSTRESVLVVLEDNPMINIMPSSHENDIQELLGLEEDSSAEQGQRARHSAWDVLENTSDAIVSPSLGPIDETPSQLDTEDEDYRGYFRNGPSKQNSGVQRPKQLMFNSNNPSLIAHSEPTQSVLEIGPGLIGTDKGSRCQLYSRVTPNPLQKDFSNYS